MLSYDALLRFEFDFEVAPRVGGLKGCRRVAECHLKERFFASVIGFVVADAKPLGSRFATRDRMAGCLACLVRKCDTQSGVRIFGLRVFLSGSRLLSVAKFTL